MTDTVLLLHPRTFHERNYRYYHIPYSLLSLVVPLQHAGLDVLLMDDNVLRSSNYEDLLTSCCRRCVCVGISVMIGQQITCAISLSRAAKRVWLVFYSCFPYLSAWQWVREMRNGVGTTGAWSSDGAGRWFTVGRPHRGG